MSINPTATRKLALDDLPKYTRWPNRLLAASAGTLFAKTRSSIYREYETDKWASLYAQIQEGGLDLNKIEVLQFDGLAEIAFSMSADLFVSSPLDTRIGLASRIADVLADVVPAEAPIVELGAGTGAVICRLARDKRFAGRRFVAGDFSPSAVKIINYVANLEGIEIEAGPFDFQEGDSELRVPRGSIIFTSFALAYVQGIDCSLWKRLMAYEPRAIVLAEPIYQFFREDTLLGLLRKRYYDANDYSKAILPSVHLAQSERLLKVSDIEENAFGVNPLCPVSFLTLLPFE